ncbi:MAG TPA: hypothetical protein VG819_13850 [Rhizomicrobium sp.]|jgi:hypothetical protein|nr:hypothetical protein [Rhizomicrobium sp.]
MKKMNGEDFSSDRMAEVYLSYLFREKANNRHVRRVASWLGLLILGIEKLADRWWVSHTRQLCFEASGKRYKVRFNHQLGKRGGIEFVEVEAAPGQPEISVVKTIGDLGEAAAFFKRPKL